MGRTSGTPGETATLPTTVVPMSPADGPLTRIRAVRSALFLVAVLPMATLLVVAVFVTDLGSLVEVLRGAGWGWIVAGSLATFARYPIMAARWNVLLRAPSSHKPGLLEGGRYLLIAQLFNLVVPGPAGDLTAAWMVRIQHGLPATQALAALSYGRLFGVVFTAALPFLLAPQMRLASDPLVQRTLQGGLVAAGAATLLMLALAFVPSGWSRLSDLARNLIPARWREAPGLLGRLVRSLIRFPADFAGHARHIAGAWYRLAVAAVLSAAVVMVNAAAFWMVLKGLGLDVSLAWAAFIVCVQVLSHSASVGVPGSGTVASPVVCVAVMVGALGVDEPVAVAALFLGWAPHIVQCLCGLGFAIPVFGPLSRYLAGE
jgi:uncharacterized membrane protein YbhN (UPF0104 family)